jgi:hypothetical protein
MARARHPSLTLKAVMVFKVLYLGLLALPASAASAANGNKCAVNYSALNNKFKK